jgi:hypothetical protein
MEVGEQEGVCSPEHYSANIPHLQVILLSFRIQTSPGRQESKVEW